MSTSVLRRISPSLSLAAIVISLLALVATSAGVGYAAGKIGSKQIQNNAITSAKIKKNAVTTKKIKNERHQGHPSVKNGSITERRPGRRRRRRARLPSATVARVTASGSRRRPSFPVTTSARRMFRKDRFRASSTSPASPFPSDAVGR